MNRFGEPEPGEFLPGITLPSAIHGQLRMRLGQIDTADSPVNCLIAHARAESLVEALEILKAIEAVAVERLYLLIEARMTVRLRELAQESSTD